MAESAERVFILRDDEGNPVPGIVGLESRPHGLTVGKDGIIPIDKLTAAQMDELERMAVTNGHPVHETEPRNVPDPAPKASGAKGKAS